MKTSSVTQQDCYHCGLPVYEADRFTLDIDNQKRQLCCPGCLAVASTILRGGLANYYQYRSELAQPANDNDLDKTAVLQFDSAAFTEKFVTLGPAGQATCLLSIEGISCAACVWLIEQQLLSIQGVLSAHVNQQQRRLSIEWQFNDLALSEIVTAINTIGYQASPFQIDEQELRLQSENRLALRRLGVAGIGMMQVGMVAIALHAGAIQGIAAEHQQLLRWLSLLFCTPVVAYSAKPFFTNALRSILNRHPNMDLPVALAIGFAFISSAYATLSGGGEVYFDSVVMFTFLLLLGRFLELKARQQLVRSDNRLGTVLPKLVPTQIAAGAEFEPLAIEALKPGYHIRIKPGETIACDGIITEGQSHIDESAFTGEYHALKKQPQETVAAGTINIDNPLTVKVTACGGQSQLSNIVRLLERASSEKPRFAILADRLSSYFVMAVILLSSLCYLYWHSVAPEKAFWIALSLLVVSCPCALSLATPTALSIASNRLRELGFVISRGHVLAALNKVDTLVFDKTGTLTQGKLTLINSDQISEQALRIACSLEQQLEHPVAQAFKRHMPAFSGTSLSDQFNHLGQGVSGTIDDIEYRIGSRAFIEAWCHIPMADSAQGQSVYLGCRDKFICQFVFDDPLRPDAQSVVKAFQDDGIEVHILTGDSSASGPLVAEQLAADHFKGHASPADKLSYIESLQSSGRHVLMIGDGINDVPVLAKANVSVAMAQASELAKTSADCFLLNSRLSYLLVAKQQAKRTNQRIKENIAWALFYNLSAVPLAAAGMIPPYLAAIGMSLSSLVVLINAMRLRKISPI